MCCQETHIFAYLTIFYWIDVVCHLWFNLGNNTDSFFPPYFDFYGPFSSNVIQQTIKNIHFYFKIKIFWWNEAVEVIEVTEAVEVIETIEAIEVLDASKITQYLKYKLSFSPKRHKEAKNVENIFWKYLYIWYIHTLFPPKKVCMFANWTIDGAKHCFNKNWYGRQKCGFLRNT